MDRWNSTSRNRPKVAIAVVCLMVTAGFGLVHLSAQDQRHRSGALRVTVEDGSEMPLYEESHALVIGASAYDKDKGWSQLPGVIKDVAEVSSALEEQGFAVERLLNPTRASFDQAMWKFIGDHGQSKNNRLVIYFAGHGATIKTEDGRALGYIVPTDAALPSSGKGAFKQSAVSMESFQTFAKEIESRHALFVFDSCFSGAIFHDTTRSVPNRIISRMAQPVRQFITAGTADQEVPDRSIFREQFVRALRGEADLNGDRYVTGTELGVFLQDKVTEYSRGTETPQWGKIIDPELNRGDFLFSLLASGEAPAVSAIELSTISKAINPAELSYWVRIANSSDPEDYKAFLAKYPHGTFAPVAELRASPRGQLRSPPSPSSSPNDEFASSIFTPVAYRQTVAEQRPTPDSGTRGAHESWYVILGSFGLSHQDKANLVMLKYQAMGYDARLINSNWGDFPNFARSLWVIVIGPSSQSAARALAREIRPKVRERPYYKQAVK